MTTNKENNSSGWTQAIVTLVIGILVTIGTTYYTIYEGNKQAVQAEQERFIKVKDNIVSIVEEHIVNQKKIDLKSLQRVIDIKSKDEKIGYLLTVTDILSQAEYNILNSRHLDINKKEEYEKSINEIHLSILTDSTYDYSKYKEAELLKAINVEINRANNQEAAKLLITLVDKYEASLKAVETENKFKDKNSFEFLFDKPSLTIAVVAIYTTLASLFLTFYRKRQRRRKEYLRIREMMEVEKMELESEIKNILELLKGNKDLEDEERLRLKERLIMLEEHLEYLRRKITTANISLLNSRVDG